MKYYINFTNDIESIPIHPVIITNETILYEADYVFLWSYSSVLLFASPTILEEISFKFITFPSHVANIVLEPFCTSLNEDHILNLLNEVTIWVRYLNITWSLELNRNIFHNTKVTKRQKINIICIFKYVYVCVCVYTYEAWKIEKVLRVNKVIL